MGLYFLGRGDGCLVQGTLLVLAELPIPTELAFTFLICELLWTMDICWPKWMYRGQLENQ